MSQFLQWVKDPIAPASRGCIPVTTPQAKTCHWAFANRKPLTALCSTRWQVVDQDDLRMCGFNLDIQTLPPCRPCLRSQKLYGRG